MLLSRLAALGRAWPRLAALLTPLAGSVLGLAVVAAVLSQPVAPRLVAVFLAVLIGQGFAFGSLGMWMSCISRTPEQALPQDGRVAVLAAIDPQMGARHLGSLGVFSAS